MTMKLVKPEEMENQVGVTLPAGEWFEIDQARINALADCTEDHHAARPSAAVAPGPRPAGARGAPSPEGIQLEMLSGAGVPAYYAWF